MTQADGKESATKKQETEPQPKQNTSNAEVTEKPKTEDKPSAPTETKKSQLYYAVQFCSSSSQKPLNCKDFKKCVPAQEFVETGTYKYKYVYGRAATFEEGVKLRDEVKTVFKDAFLVVIKDGKKLPMEEARQYFKSSK